MMKDAFDYQDKAIYRALAGGVTTSLLCTGSANMDWRAGDRHQAQVRSVARRTAFSECAAVDQICQR